MYNGHSKRGRDALKTVDLFMFMGQSNMAGRGIVSDIHPEPAPELFSGAGYEYRAVTAPDMLSELCEPFGCRENRADGINDGDMKTGSMVTSFVNAYYGITGVPVVGVSASKGGSRIEQWQPDTPFLNDAAGRLDMAVRYLEDNGYVIRHKYMLWCQGESDGDVRTPAEVYKKRFFNMLDVMKKHGIEKCFLIKTGEYNGGEDYTYHEIQMAQDGIAAVSGDVVIVSERLAEMKERGLMKDAFHYFQQAYNEVGHDAGINTAAYVGKLI